MSTFSATLHQRVATPVTPHHSPQLSQHSLHSTSSARSHTPVHSLSLHEYRKQQTSPKTPDPPEGRRLKRKAAATRLNGSEREPLLQLQRPNPPRLPPSPPSTSHSEPHRREPDSSFTGLQVSSFRSLPALQQRPSLGLRDIARLNASSADLPPVGASNAPARPRDFGLGTRKRLPRPKDIEIRQPLAASPIPTESSSLNLLSTAGLASTSTFTLSKFPFPEPPQTQLAGQVSPPLNVWPRESNLAHTPSLLDTPPASPAVLHFRGTSFDVVNPHNSLYLSNLETPADPDEPNDYFNRTSLDQLLPADMSPSSTQGEGAAKQPQRPLFDDLRSAHESIAKSKVQSSRPTRNPPHDHAEAVLSSVIPAHLSNKPDRRASIIDRARTVFKRKESRPVEVDEELKGVPYNSTSNAYGAPATDAFSSSATIVPEHARVDAARPSGDTWETLSEPTAPQYDQMSVYPDTEFDSNSLYFGPISNRRSVPFGVQNQITDYSGEISYEFDDTPRHSYMNLTRNPSVNNRGARTLSKTIDNTLGNIYDQYGGGEPYDATISTDELITDDEDDDATTVKGPSLRSMIPTSPRDNRISGFSKFNFELDDVRNSGNPESPVTSPVTPQDGMFPRALAVMRAAPGNPPNFPPPLASGELGEARRVYAHASEDYSNRASSYGDTRRLLGLSGNIDATNRMSAITEASRFSEGEKLPPSPLQEFIERCDSQRGTPELEEYREQSQNSLLSSDTDASKHSDVSVGGIAFQMGKENVAPVRPEPGLRKQAIVSNAERNSTGSDIPPMWMRSASPGPAAQRNESPATLATDCTDGDWETLAQTTTAGDHTRHNSVEPELPTQDATPPQRTNTNPWRRNKIAEGDSSSPIVTSPTETKDIPRFPRDSQLSFLRHSRLGRDVRHSTLSASNSTSSRPFGLSADQVKDLVAFGPSDEIVEEYEMSPLAYRAESQELDLSSPPMNRSSRFNSFDKFALVGPEANLTGTPMGTGMRFAGSSTAGSSSNPPSNAKAYQELFTSSPPSLSTPTRQNLLGRSPTSDFYSPTGGRIVSSDYHNPFQTPTPYKSSPLSRGSIVSSQSSRIPAIASYGKEIDSLRAASSSRAEHYRKIRAASVGSSRTSTPRVNGTAMPRASVQGMTSPFSLTLQCQNSATLGSDRSEPGTVVRPSSSRTAEPLYRHSPHLLQLPRPQSSNMTEVVKKKTRLSWMIFAICAWFPPTAILMFFGALDGLMFQMSGREISHVGHFQKKCALVAFISELVLLILVMTLWLVHVI